MELVGEDSVVAWDYARSILSYWSPSGEFLAERAAGTHRTIHQGELLPDGTLAVGADDGSVHLYDLSIQSETNVIQAHAGPVLALAFRPDGSALPNLFAAALT